MTTNNLLPNADGGRRRYIRLDNQRFIYVRMSRKMTLDDIARASGYCSIAIVQASEGKPIRSEIWFYISVVLGCHPQEILCDDDRRFLGYEDTAVVDDSTDEAGSTS